MAAQLRGGPVVLDRQEANLTLTCVGECPAVGSPGQGAYLVRVGGSPLAARHGPQAYGPSPAGERPAIGREGHGVDAEVLVSPSHLPLAALADAPQSERVVRAFFRGESLAGRGEGLPVG